MDRSRFPAWLAALLLALVTVLAYQPVWHAGFIWDDDALVTANPLLKAGCRGLLDIWASAKFHDYVPLTLTTFWLEWRLWGENPLGYHVLNVLLHACSAVLLWRGLKRLRIPGAGLAAALFAVHPVNVESVAWVAERKNTLAMLFYLLSLLLYLHSEDNPKAGIVNGIRANSQPPSTILHPPSSLLYWLSLMSFALALLSKTAVAPLPVVLLGLAWWQRGRVDFKDLWRSVPFFVLAAAAGFVALWFQYSRAIGASLLDVRSGSLWSRLVGAGWAAWFYLYKAVLPLNLSFVYPRWRIDPTNVLSCVPSLLVVLAFALCWRYRRGWGKAGLFALGYFVVMLLPALGFVNIYFMRFSLVADHWQYFSIIGPIALIAGALTGAEQRLVRANPHLGTALGGAVILLLSLLTWKQAHIYVDQEALWQDTLAKNPACWMAHINLGNVLSDKGQFDEAIRQYQEAIHLQPVNADAHNNLGARLIRKGQIYGAIREFREAIRVQPDHVGAHYNLGAALQETGQLDEAIRQYQEAIRLKPNNADAYGNLGIALAMKGKTDEAIRQFREALRLKPNEALAHYNLGVALYKDGQIEEAISQLQEALRLKPDDADAKSTLAKVLERKPHSNPRTSASVRP
jgi:protein O-mannosyl-transferase